MSVHLLTLNVAAAALEADAKAQEAARAQEERLAAQHDRAQRVRLATYVSDILGLHSVSAPKAKPDPGSHDYNPFDDDDDAPTRRPILTGDEAFLAAIQHSEKKNSSDHYREYFVEVQGIAFFTVDEQWLEVEVPGGSRTKCRDLADLGRLIREAA